MHPVQLTGVTVKLREFTSADAGPAVALVGDDRVTQWLSFDSRSPSEAATMVAGIVERTQLEPRTEYYLAVTLADHDEVIGFARIGFNGVKAAKLGYATDAARTLIDFGFTQLGLHRISAAIGPDNAASIAVVKRLGFELEGCIRDHVWTNGAWRDSQLYSVLADEWVVRPAA